VTDPLQRQEIPAEHLLPDLAPQVLAAVIRRFQDCAAGEHAVQEAGRGYGLASDPGTV
jgi:hypothetical protein